MKEVKKMGRPRSTAEGGKNYTFYLSREVGEKVKELGGAKWITKKILEVSPEIQEMIELRKKIERLENEKIITLDFDPCGNDYSYFDTDTLANYAKLRFEERDGDFFYTVTDDREQWKLVIPRLLDGLIDDRTLNRGSFFGNKADAKKHLDESLKDQYIDKERYDELVQELNELKLN